MTVSVRQLFFWLCLTTVVFRGTCTWPRRRLFAAHETEDHTEVPPKVIGTDAPYVCDEDMAEINTQPLLDYEFADAENSIEVIEFKGGFCKIAVDWLQSFGADFDAIKRSATDVELATAEWVFGRIMFVGIGEENAITYEQLHTDNWRLRVEERQFADIVFGIQQSHAPY